MNSRSSARSRRSRITRRAAALIVLLAACSALLNRRPSEPREVTFWWGRQLLWGGDDSNQHFDVTEFRLQPERLAFGRGRDAFPAIVQPRFESVLDASEWLDDNSPVLAVQVGEDVRVYPVTVLQEYELVNDTVGGRPILAAYCGLADLGAIYDREMNGAQLTFAPSGYTYSDSGIWEGRQAFLLWDHQTDSLWWPLAGKAVAGPMVDAPLRLLEDSLWAQTDWQTIQSQFPDAQILSREQPAAIASDDNETQPDAKLTGRPPSGFNVQLPPRWGENPSFGRR